MKRIFILTVIAMLATVSQAQIGIGTKNPNPAAKLHVSSESQGVLIPSISSFAQITSDINNLSPADKADAVGMMVFYNVDSLFYTWDGTDWQCMNPIKTNATTGTITPKNPYKSFEGNGTIPVGGIIMWSGDKNNVPEGWALCNGANNTPDLRGRFIVGYSDNNSTLTEDDSYPTNQGGYHENSQAGNSNYASPGNPGGNPNTSLNINNLPSHNHSATLSNTNHTHPSGSLSIANSGAHQHQTRGASGLGGNANFRRGSGNNNGWVATRTDAANYNGSHTHTISGSTGTNSATPTATIGNTGLGSSFSNRPPYYVMAFIMRVE